MYKVGSCFLENILTKNNIPHVKLHSYDNLEQNQYPIESITHVISVRRDPLKLYMSAFFEDIDKIEDYPYAFGTSEDVENATVEELITHFNKQDWKRYRWLNFDYYNEWLENFKKLGKHILLLNCDTLSNNIVDKFHTFLKRSLVIDSTPTHVRTIENQFGKKYQEFKEKLLSNLQESNLP
jgi:hypothetical protein